MIGTLLGNRYEILELIGTGGMANVYKARCTLLNRYVAVKVLKDEYKNDEEFIKRFNIESQAAAGLSHTNIVSVYDVGTDGDIHYIVMEYVDGITLKEYLKRAGGPLKTETALDFSIQIASALQQAHKRGVIHRDIKPQNILVTKDGTLKVTDFGIARAVSSFTMKVDDSAIGTAHYCSPEQAKGGYTDEKSDIYSFGVVMYEMFTGKLPFESDSSVSVAIQQIQEEPKAPHEIVPDIPPQIEIVILRAMQKEQSQRFQNVREMALELNWIKQNMYDGVKTVHTPIYPERTDSEVTRILSMDDVKKASDEDVTEPQNPHLRTYESGSALQDYRAAKHSKKKTKTQSSAKDDKTTVVAAIISSVVVVFVVAFIGVIFLFPELMHFGGKGGEKGFKVPDLMGVKLEKAEEKYKDVTFKVEYDYSTAYEEGYIMHQEPDSGTYIEDKPYEIKVTVSKGTKVTEVPDVVGKSYSTATKMLEAKNISYNVEYEKNDDVKEQNVISVSPSVGTKLKAGKDSVTLVVSEGPEEKTVDVPNVLGMTESEASQTIANKELKYSIVYQTSTKTKGIVISQSTSAGTSVPTGTVVTITISAGHTTAQPEQSGTSQSGSQNPGTTTEE